MRKKTEEERERERREASGLAPVKKKEYFLTPKIKNCYLYLCSLSLSQSSRKAGPSRAEVAASSSRAESASCCCSFFWFEGGLRSSFFFPSSSRRKKSFK